MCANTGPGWKRKLDVACSKIDMPTMSAGSMSLVNWIRRNDEPEHTGKDRASSVLPTPGHILDQQVAARQQAA